MIENLAYWSLPAIRRGSLMSDPQAEEVMTKRSSLRVVVVDDNYDANAALSRLLEKSGFEVAGRAYDGLSGLKVIKESAPDVAILDIAMPALDGFGLARRVKSEVESPPHLVALTGFGTEENKTEAVSAGFEAYFRKPADWPALKSLLEGYSKAN
jgi:CheY-like chemotaxis protein